VTWPWWAWVRKIPSRPGGGASTGQARSSARSCCRKSGVASTSQRRAGEPSSRARQAAWRRSEASSQAGRQHSPRQPGQVGGEAVVKRLPLLPALVEGGQEDEAQRVQGGVPSDGLGQGEAVHLRHGQVQQGQVERVAHDLRRLQPLQGLDGAGGAGAADAPVVQVAPQDVPVGGVVVDHQDPQPGQRGAQAQRQPARLGARRSGSEGDQRTGGTDGRGALGRSEPAEAGRG
jgi:hypothetical protein